jgi:hypothetical protein
VPVIFIKAMERPHLQPKEKPSKFCSLCKREVYGTIHTSESYWADWYTKFGKVICVDCYER